MQKPTSQLMKYYLAWNLRNRRGYTVVATEFDNHRGKMDICGVIGNIVVEFEIKVSKSDFDGEMHAIHACRHEQKPGSCNKYLKHRVYRNTFNKTIEKKEKFDHRIPTYMIYVVPRYLADYAKFRLQNTPYGLWVLEDKPRSFEKGSPSPDTIFVRKSPTKIHEIDSAADLIADIAKRLTNENISMRNELLPFDQRRTDDSSQGTE